MEFQRKINALWQAKAREEAELKHRYFQEMQDLVVMRAVEIRKLEGFWSTAVQNHNGLQALLTSRDMEVVRAIEDINVGELIDEAGPEAVKLTIYLGNNPIVASSTLWIQVTSSSPRTCTSSGILFHSNYSFTWLDSSSKGSFFRLFECHNASADSSWETEKAWELVQWVKTDLWEDPLKYFELSR